MHARSRKLIYGLQTRGPRKGKCMTASPHKEWVLFAVQKNLKVADRPSIMYR